MENGYSATEHGRLVERVDYLVKCCDKMEKEMESAKTRSVATLTSVIILLVGTITNLILYYAK